MMHAYDVPALLIYMCYTYIYTIHTLRYAFRTPTICRGKVTPGPPIYPRSTSLPVPYFLLSLYPLEGFIYRKNYCTNKANGEKPNWLPSAPLLACLYYSAWHDGFLASFLFLSSKPRPFFHGFGFLPLYVQ